jgi:uncharacterized phosphosugar-binding protein
MSKLTDSYLNSLIKLLERIRDEEAEVLEKAAKMIADAIEGGQRIFGFGCTHSSLPIQDIVYRAGGLLLINPLYGPGIASLDVRPAKMTSAIERLPGYARILLDSYPIQKGDILILVSVSGRNAVPIELAQLAQERGIKVIGVTSREYTGNVESRHPSGKKMYDFADIILDNYAPKGDALVEAEGFPVKFTPASGVTSNAVLHALMTATIEELLRRGITPPVAIAANVEGGMEHNERIWEEYKDRIFYL